MQSRVALIVIAVSAIASAGAVGYGHVWGYLPSPEEPYGPEHWHLAYPDAAGQHQSPIDIKTADVVALDSLRELHFDYEHNDVKIVNNGATVDVEIEEPKENKLVDAYGVEYLLTGVHFHWHQTNDQLGTEHTLDGVAHALEAHYVHYKSSFASLADAVAHNVSGDLLVYGVLFEVADRGAEGFDPVLAVASKLTAPNASLLVGLEGFDPEVLLPEHAESQYYHYKGSLTTPGCSEVVHWYLAKETQKITHAQLELIRAAEHDSEGNVTSNYRMTMPLNGRTVWSRAPHRSNRRSLAWVAAPVVLGLAALAAVGTPLIVFLVRRRNENEWMNLNQPHDAPQREEDHAVEVVVNAP
eukprot:m51a1_g5773 putative carbonic anhydrase 2 (355) ;mRNA; r:1249144-1250435